MEEKKNNAVIILIVLIVISLGLAGGTFYSLTQAKKKNVELDQQLQELTAKHNSTLMELEDSKAKISSLQASVSETETRLSTIKGNLDKEKTAKEAAIAQLNQIKADLEKELGVKGELEKKLADSETALKDMEARVAEMDKQLKGLETQKTDLEKKVKNYEAKFGDVALGTIIVNPEAPAAKKSAVKMEGRVLVVNKDYNFAVINLGTKDNLAAGTVFTVFHNNKSIGELKVEKVHEAMSAAGFGSEAVKEKIAEGDRVELKS
jgi:predicted RNase H-like nuclease (RuvC/YqgF family)